MDEGRVVGIFVISEAQAPLASVREVRAEAGRGLEGDRYWLGQGTFWKRQPDYEVTLVETEALEALAAETGVMLQPRETRRNLATRGVRLNALVGQYFRVGETTFMGIRLCEPCGHLERLTGRRLRPALNGRGGLRAGIVTGGVIRVGDAIEVEREQEREAVGPVLRDENTFTVAPPFRAAGAGLKPGATTDPSVPDK